MSERARPRWPSAIGQWVDRTGKKKLRIGREKHRVAGGTMAVEKRVRMCLRQEGEDCTGCGSCEVPRAPIQTSRRTVRKGAGTVSGGFSGAVSLVSGRDW